MTAELIGVELGRRLRIRCRGGGGGGTVSAQKANQFASALEECRNVWMYTSRLPYYSNSGSIEVNIEQTVIVLKIVVNVS